MKRKLFLASTSPRRHKLAKVMGLDFEIISSNYKEDMSLKLSPSKLVMMFAEGKASEAASRFKKGIIIGVDTICTIDNHILGKPKNKEDAFRILKLQSGKTVEVYSGICLIDLYKNRKILDHEVSRVRMRRLSDSEIERYIATGEPMDKAGAIAIQGLGSIFVSSIEGCYFNIEGFPIYNIFKNLSKLGVDIFEYEQWKK